MAKKISLDAVLEQEGAHLARLSPHELEVMMDTNSWRYRFSRSPHKIVITPGIQKELDMHPHFFPPYSVGQLKSILNPKTVVPFPSLQDESLIALASLKYQIEKTRKQEGDVDFSGLRQIGWVDTQQLAHALQNARNRERTIIITNDGDLLGAVKHMRRMNIYARQGVHAVSIQRYIERKYGGLLKGVRGKARLAAIRELEQGYLIAA